MSSPSPEAITLIRAKITNWNRPDATILTDLNSPSIANPSSQPTVPQPFSSEDLVLACPESARSSLAGLLDLAAPYVIAQDVVRMKGGLRTLVLTKSLPQALADAMITVLNRTMPDPAYRSQISWAELTLGRLLDLQDIQAARPTS